MKRILPLTYLLIALLVIAALGLLCPWDIIVPSPWNLFGITPIALGVWINLLADKALHRAKTTVKPFEEPTALVIHGVYGISRHPMYLGFVLILLGSAMLLGGWTPYLVISVFIFLMELLFIRYEEKAMQDKFGRVWLEYKHRARRWI